MVAPVFDKGAPVWSHYCSTSYLRKVQNTYTLQILFGSGHQTPPSCRSLRYVLDAHKNKEISFKLCHYGATYCKRGKMGISKRVFLVILACKNLMEEVKSILAECNLLP